MFTRSVDDAEAIGLVSRSTEDLVFDETDPELEPLLSQFGSHLESIQANGMQLDGLGEAISRAHAALSTAVP